MRIAFVGTGAMGAPMAANLLGAGHEVVAWNRSLAKAEALVAAGARLAATPAEAAASAPVVVSMLADDAAVERVVFQQGLLDGMPAGGTHVSMSTIGVALATRLAEAHASSGRVFVSAPVFGRPEAAAAAKLFIVAAGPRVTVDALGPVFAALGQRTFVVGEAAPAANVVKLAGNFMIASVIESLGESFALVRKSGVDPAVFLEVLTSSLFDAPIYRTYGGIIAAERYHPAGFRLGLGLKDIGLALAAAQQAGVPMPIASLVRDRFITAIARGDGEADWSAIAKASAGDAGL